MRLNRIVNLWPPFTELVLLRVDPAHYHVVIGASSELYVALGPSGLYHDLAGASQQLYVLESSE